ncbi:putative elicitin [Plasmopara halstedii]
MDKYFSLTHIVKSIFKYASKKFNSLPLLTMLAELLVTLSLLFYSGDAAECTDAESARAALVWDRAAASTACSPYVIQYDPVSVNAPCTASGCVSIVEIAAQDLPNCTFNGSNKKVAVLNALRACDYSKLLIAATDSSRHPNLRSSSLANESTTSSLTETSALTLQSMSCSTSEIKNMWYMYVTTATSEECAAESDINGGNIEIIAQCESSCTETIRSLVDTLPDCNYEFEGLNKKQNVLEQLNNCKKSPGSISIALFSENFDQISRSGALQVSENTSESSARSSLPDNSMESSNIKSGCSSTLSHHGKVLTWISLTVAIIFTAKVYY